MKKIFILLGASFFMATVNADDGRYCNVDVSASLRSDNAFGNCQAGDVIQTGLNKITTVCDFSKTIFLADQSKFGRDQAFCVYRGSPRTTVK
ncbi:MAG: hypothetical protein RRB22_12185 [Gammaproteobacteria bacterium]|nr:hypothetical protein [Gammaproteobacteria bacterium]